MPARMIDPHHHLYDLEANPYPWLQLDEPPRLFVGDLRPVMKTYDLERYLADCRPCGVQKSVHVEVGWDPTDPVGETQWLQGIADRHGFPHGIVASAELHEAGAADVLDRHCESANMRGVRQMLLTHTDPLFDLAPRADLLTDPQWRAGFALLEGRGLSFDLQVYPHQMADAADLAASFPDTQIVLDHAGLPIERQSGGLERWRTGMRGLAARPNVTVKISGLGQVDHHWTLESIRPIVAETIDTFGVERCMFASNFPIDSLYSDYATLISSFEAIVSALGLSEAESDAVFYTNAERVYRL
jgi:predicted TIM-barrel fold metal-dependent hydrolase